MARRAQVGGMVFGYLYLHTGKPLDKFKDYLDRWRLNRLKKRCQIIRGGQDDDSGPTVRR